MQSKLRILGQSGIAPQQGATVVGQLKKTSVRINSNGDQIDPETKQIIKKNDPGFTIATPNFPEQ